MRSLVNEVSGVERILECVTPEQYEQWLQSMPDTAKNWIVDSGFRPIPGAHITIPDTEGHCCGAVVVVDDTDPLWGIAHLATYLPAGTYRFRQQYESKVLRMYALGWELHSYEYNRYKTSIKHDNAKLLIADPVMYQELSREVDAVALVRDLINTPAEDMGPTDLAFVANELAAENGGEARIIDGKALLEYNYPAIHAVGRGSSRPPVLIDLEWGRSDKPLIAIVGKGVCFDSGGLDIKDASWMRLMKKDMGGGAHALGLAKRIIEEDLPLRVRVLIPAVDNALSGNSYRPGDVINTRKGLTLEIDNTDAEGRVVLCDALAAAVEEPPALLIDFATLTSAARQALGADVPAFFTRNDQLAEELELAARKVVDPVWRLPLVESYRSQLNSEIADIANRSSALGDSIIAALFLSNFVPSEVDWLHMDLMGWNLVSRPGRPYGGEAMGLRAVYEYLKCRFCEAPLPTTC